MATTPDKIIKDLKAGQYEPVYFLHGEEPYYLDLISDHIEEHALDEASKGFNQVVLYGKDVGVVDLLTQARRFPMMSEKQTVIVKEAQEIKDINKEEGQNLLDEYLQNPVRSTILVLVYKHKSIDKRKKFWKSIDKKAVVVESKKMYDNQVPGWITSYVKGKGHQIEEKATHMMTDNIGNNLQRLTNEIEKILINFKSAVNITPQLVQQYVGINKDYNAFELQKAIANRDVLKANRIVNYFGDNPKGNPVLPVLAVLYSFFTKMLIAHQVGGGSEQSLASKLRVSPYFVKEYVSAMNRYPVHKVAENIHHLRDADLAFKGVNAVNLTEKQLLRELVFKLMH